MLLVTRWRLVGHYVNIIITPLRWLRCHYCRQLVEIITPMTLLVYLRWFTIRYYAIIAAYVYCLVIGAVTLSFAIKISNTRHETLLIIVIYWLLLRWNMRRHIYYIILMNIDGLRFTIDYWHYWKLLREKSDMFICWLKSGRYIADRLSLLSLPLLRHYCYYHYYWHYAITILLLYWCFIWRVSIHT